VRFGLNIHLAAVVVSTITAAAAPRNELAAAAPITVCVETGAGVEPDIVERGEITAGRMFAMIGLRIEWLRQGPLCPSAEDPILLSVANGTPDSYRPRAYGLALPYEGIHVRVFYDRVHRLRPDLLVPALAHVFVHEIAHVLSGTDSHSDTGVMKFRWSQSDLEQMAIQPMRFSALDISLLKSGIPGRRMRVAGARMRAATPAEDASSE
jgi:hypothetical protein